MINEYYCLIFVFGYDFMMKVSYVILLMMIII